MAFNKPKQVAKYTYEESEHYFRQDCASLLTKEQFNAAHNAGMEAAKDKTTDLRKWQAYNARLSRALREHLGIDSWRDWKMQELGQNTKPKRVFTPPRTEKLNGGQMQNLISTNKPKRGRGMILEMAGVDTSNM